MTPQLANAFDEEREGFILGLGVGLQHINLDYSYFGYKIQSDSKGGLVTSLKIGAGITNQFSLYFFRNASWFNAPISNGFTTSDTTYLVGISGIGATYYLSPSAPSAYFLGAIGVGDISAPLEKDVKSDIGKAFSWEGDTK